MLGPSKTTGIRRGSARPLAHRRIGPAAEQATPPAANPREAWAQACAARLGELAGSTDRRALERLAAQLWREAGGFDPVIAAEMEFESGSSAASAETER